MLRNGDPIIRLADCLNNLIVQKKENDARVKNDDIMSGGNNVLIANYPLLKLLFSRKKAFNRSAYENDVFNKNDVKQKVNAWRNILVQ